MDLFAATRELPGVVADVKTIVDDYSGWHWLNKDPRMNIRPSARERLGDIDVPTLVVVGEKDLSYFHDIAMIIAKGIPNARRVVVKDAGHMVNLEQPQVTNELIGQLVSREMPDIMKVGVIRNVQLGSL